MLLEEENKVKIGIVLHSDRNYNVYAGYKGEKKCQNGVRKLLDPCP